MAHAPATGHTAVAPASNRNSRWLASGETMVARFGLALAGVLIAGVVFNGWWVATLQREEAKRAEQLRIDAVTTLLAEHAVALVERERLAELRRGVVEIAQQHHLDSLTVALPGGRIIASSQPADISAEPLPDTWTDQPLAPIAASRESRTNAIIGHTSSVVRGRGALIVHARSLVPAVAWTTSEVATGIAAAGIGALGLSWIAYRSLRRRVRAMSIVRDSLLLSSQGVPASSATLWVSSDFGPEAQAWNALLTQLDTLRNGQSADRLKLQFASRRSGDGGALNAAFDAIPDGLILVDEALRVKFANGAAAVLLGCRREELNGSELAKRLNAEPVMTAIRDVAIGENRSRRTVELATEGAGDTGALARIGPGGMGGGAILRFHIRPVRKEDNAAVMIVIEDVTQQRIADESRNSFVASAAHELRTPLTNIRLYVEQLTDPQMTDANERGKALNVISIEVKRLERLIEDMLSVSEIEAGAMKLRRGDVRLDSLFDELLHDFEAQSREKDIALELALPPKLPVIQGDREKITLALHNLVGNALKYTPAGGRVTVKVECPNSTLNVEVIDNGIGIKPDEIEMVFEKFYRAKDRRITSITGTGLGLPIARQVARLHGGDITCRSQLDKGSTFIFTLPLGLAA
jgi:PAS domain S-box-containing protein